MSRRALLPLLAMAALGCHYVFTGAQVARIVERNVELERLLGRSEGENRALRERCASPGTLILRFPPQPMRDAGPPLPDATERLQTY